MAVKPRDLALKCAEAINSATALELPAKDAVVLVVLPKGWKAPPKFPRGRTAQWKEDGSRVVYLNAMNTLAWLAASGAVQVETAIRQ